MRPVLVVAFVAACAAPRAEERAPAAAVAPSGETPGCLPEGEERPLYAARLVARLKEARLEECREGRRDEKWPRRAELPKPEDRYDAALLWFGGSGCAELCEVLVDLDDPRVFWLRHTGGVAGIREYRGPAEILTATGPLEYRVAEG